MGAYFFQSRNEQEPNFSYKMIKQKTANGNTQVVLSPVDIQIALHQYITRLEKDFKFCKIVPEVNITESAIFTIKA